MKMHLLDGGRVRIKKHIYVPDAPRDELFELPVIATLFRHPHANVLFDTGCHPSVSIDPSARWGGLAKFMTPIAPIDSGVVSSLAYLNLKPTDIDIVVNSHLHPDHCGCNEFFTKAEFYIHEKELEVACAADSSALGYIRQEWDHPMRVNPINSETDLMNDGQLVMIPLPGHTPGSIGMRVDLARDGGFVLASDAVSLLRNLEYDEVPKNAWSADHLLSSYETLRRLQNLGDKIIGGHDDGQWQALKKGKIAYE